MTIFDEISITYTKLKRAKEKLDNIELQAYSPRLSNLSDMPKGGGGTSNPLEQYIINKEKLTERQEALGAQLEKQWVQAKLQMKAAKIDKQTVTMMYLRFMCNKQWKKCAAELNTKYPNCKWNVNKCFRKYKEVICRMRKI